MALNSFIGLITTCSNKVVKHYRCVDNQLNRIDGIYFIDLFDSNWGGKIPNEIMMLAKNSKVVLFNVQDNLLCEKNLLLAGFDGIFYYTDRPDIVLKGLNQIRNNERWFKRSSMNHAFSYLLKSNKTSISPVNNATVKSVFPTLTKRENTIINLVTKGSQNQEIADQLNISTNTVKTHIYSIFRKTKSRNRIELITWSLQPLSS
jgi:DNA-binding NarL/FixJ family response regulator